ncbi:MAG: hypothetical protein HY275_07535 [Gemmatimonadetes bacterium]|nr:hypothetical protein [Gemmatimonadota bacterium]
MSRIPRSAGAVARLVPLLACLAVTPGAAQSVPVGPRPQDSTRVRLRFEQPRVAPAEVDGYVQGSTPRGLRVRIRDDQRLAPLALGRHDQLVDEDTRDGDSVTVVVNARWLVGVWSMPRTGEPEVSHARGAARGALIGGGTGAVLGLLGGLAALTGSHSCTGFCVAPTGGALAAVMVAMGAMTGTVVGTGIGALVGSEVMPWDAVPEAEWRTRIPAGGP